MLPRICQTRRQIPLQCNICIQCHNAQKKYSIYIYSKSVHNSSHCTVKLKKKKNRIITSVLCKMDRRLNPTYPQTASISLKCLPVIELQSICTLQAPVASTSIHTGNSPVRREDWIFSLQFTALHCQERGSERLHQPPSEAAGTFF